MPCLEPPITHASSVEDVELSDEDEDVDITNTDPAPIPEDGSIVGKDVKLDPELDLMKSSNLIKVSQCHKSIHLYSLTVFLCASRITFINIYVPSCI